MLSQRGTRRKEYKKCKYMAKVNSEELCHDCEEEMAQMVKCGRCKYKVEDGAKAVQCDGCDLWYPSRCEDMSGSMYQEMRKAKSMFWFCKQ